MERKNSSLAGLIKACGEMLRVSKKYAHLWDEEDIWKRDENDKYPEKALCIAWGFIEQDESFNIYITKKDNKFVFVGKSFLYDDEKNGLGARQAALRIKNSFGSYSNMDADAIRRRFYSSLKKPLGKYLGKKELEKIMA